MDQRKSGSSTKMASPWVSWDYLAFLLNIPMQDISNLCVSNFALTVIHVGVFYYNLILLLQASVITKIIGFKLICKLIHILCSFLKCVTRDRFQHKIGCKVPKT